MEQQQLKRCPIGVQTFEKVIEGNYLYICLLYTSDAADEL